MSEDRDSDRSPFSGASQPGAGATDSGTGPPAKPAAARRRRRLVLVAVVAVALIGAVVAGIVVSTSGSNQFVGASAAQLYAQEAKFGTFNPAMSGEDPDEMDRGGNNVDDTVRFLGNGRYQLIVQNVGFLGFINSFSWNAPNVVITKVLGSSSGTCSAAPERKVLTQYGTLPEGSLSCVGMAIKPPKCSCEAGGTATITFEGHPLVSTKHVTYGIEESRLVVGNLTLLPYHIPSYLGGGANADLPLCAKGQQSTKAHPCVNTR